MFVPTRLGRLLAARRGQLLAIAMLMCAAWFGVVDANGVTTACVGVTNGVRDGTAQPGRPCWVEVTPYPFGSEGEPVTDPESGACNRTRTNPERPCHLVVTSFAFRAWNRGLAAARTTAGPATFGVWIYNGNRWFPDPTFPGGGVCSGDTIVWAGKLDYWLVGPNSNIAVWPSLCRFDGDSQTWLPLSVPTATRVRTTKVTASGQPVLRNGQPERVVGSIRNGTCTAWDSCWFFGPYGTILRWNGTALQDVSPDPGLIVPPGASAARTSSLLTGFTDAASVRDAEGRSAALAVGGSGSTGERGSAVSDQLVAQPGGAPPPQLWALRGSDWGALGWTPATRALPNDPFRTDLAAVALDPSGQGWIAGNPTRRGIGGDPFQTSGPSPISTMTLNGSDGGCGGPSAAAFGNGLVDANRDAFLWSDLATFPGGRRAVAAGSIKARTDSVLSLNRDRSAEPVLAVVDCAGATQVTRFDEEDPTATDPKPLIPANRFLGEPQGVSVSAPAGNVAWAAVRSPGFINVPDGVVLYTQPPRLYQLTDGQPPDSPRGDDNEPRPPVLQEDVPIVVFDPGPPPPPPPPPQSPRSRTRPLPPAIFAIKSNVTNGALVVTFRVRRSVMIGIAAERNGTVVATTGLRRFRPGRGRLELKLDPKNWPTKISFLSDAPTVALAAPKTRVSGTLTLRATASAITGRRIKSVAFEYSRFGRDQWTQIGNVDTKAPYAIKFNTATVPNARYRFRAVAIDTADQSAISKDVPPTVIANREAD